MLTLPAIFASPPTQFNSRNMQRQASTCIHLGTRLLAPCPCQSRSHSLTTIGRRNPWSEQKLSPLSGGKQAPSFIIGYTGPPVHTDATISRAVECAMQVSQLLALCVCVSVLTRANARQVCYKSQGLTLTTGKAGACFGAAQHNLAKFNFGHRWLTLG